MIHKMIKGVNVYAYWSDKKNKVMFRLEHSVIVEHFINDAPLLLIIPKGYETDFASVPSPLWSIIPPIGKSNIAALTHDYLYDNQIGSRKDADKTFLKIMLQYGEKKISAYLMYWAVRLFAKSWWDK